MSEDSFFWHEAISKLIAENGRLRRAAYRLAEQYGAHVDLGFCAHEAQEIATGVVMWPGGDEADGYDRAGAPLLGCEGRERFIEAVWLIEGLGDIPALYEDADDD